MAGWPAILEARQASPQNPSPAPVINITSILKYKYQGPGLAVGRQGVDPHLLTWVAGALDTRQVAAGWDMGNRWQGPSSTSMATSPQVEDPGLPEGISVHLCTTCLCVSVHV